MPLIKIGSSNFVDDTISYLFDWNLGIVLEIAAYNFDLVTACFESDYMKITQVKSHNFKGSWEWVPVTEKRKGKYYCSNTCFIYWWRIGVWSPYFLLEKWYEISSAKNYVSFRKKRLVWASDFKCFPCFFTSLVPFYPPSKSSGKHRFSDVFRWYRKRLMWNGWSKNVS